MLSFGPSSAYSFTSSPLPLLYLATYLKYALKVSSLNFFRQVMSHVLKFKGYKSYIKGYRVTLSLLSSAGACLQLAFTKCGLM